MQEKRPSQRLQNMYQVLAGQFSQAIQKDLLRHRILAQLIGELIENEKGFSQN